MITRLGRFNEKKLQKIFNKKVYLNWLKHISNLPFIVSCLRQRWTSKAERLYWLCRLSSSWKNACSGLLQANPLLFFGLNPSFPFPYIEWHMYDFGRKKVPYNNWFGDCKFCRHFGSRSERRKCKNDRLKIGGGHKRSGYVQS